MNRIFDDYDIAKMPEFYFTSTIRLKLETAVDMYLTATSAAKKFVSHRQDSYILKSLIPRLDKEYADEVKLYDIQILFNSLIEEGKSQASLKS